MDDCHGHRRNFSIYYFLAFIMTLIYKVLYSLLTLFLCLLATKHLLHIQLPTIINSYTNDLLCMPIVLTICLIAVQKIKKDDSIRLSLFTIISLTIYYAIYFEYYQPKIKLTKKIYITVLSIDKVDPFILKEYKFQFNKIDLSQILAALLYCEIISNLFEGVAPSIINGKPAPTLKLLNFINELLILEQQIYLSEL